MISKEVISAFDDFTRTVHDEKDFLRRKLIGEKSLGSAGLNLPVELKAEIDAATLKLDAATDYVAKKAVRGVIGPAVYSSPQVKTKGQLLKNTINILEPVTQEVDIPGKHATFDFVAIRFSKPAPNSSPGVLTINFDNGITKTFSTDESIPVFANIFGYLQAIDIETGALGLGYYVRHKNGLAKVEPGKLTQFVYAESGEEIEWPIAWPTDYQLTAPLVSVGSVNLNYDISTESLADFRTPIPKNQDSKLVTAGDKAFPINHEGVMELVLLDKGVIGANTRWRATFLPEYTSNTIPDAEWLSDYGVVYFGRRLHISLINKVVGEARSKSLIRAEVYESRLNSNVVERVGDSSLSVTMPDGLVELTAYSPDFYLARSDRAALGEVSKPEDAHSFGALNGTHYGDVTVEHLLDIPLDVEVDKVYFDSNSYHSLIILDQTVGAPYLIRRKDKTTNTLTRLTGLDDYIVRPSFDGQQNSFFCFKKNGTEGKFGIILSDGRIKYSNFEHPLADVDDILTSYAKYSSMVMAFIRNNSTIDVYKGETHLGKSLKHMHSLKPGNFTEVSLSSDRDNVHIMAYTKPPKGQQLSIVTYATRDRLVKKKHLITCTGYGNSLL